MALLNLPGHFVLISALLAPGLHLAAATWILCGKKGRGSVLALTANGLSLLASALVFLNVWNRESFHFAAEWFSIADQRFYAGVLLNNLSALMLLLVSAIALLVQIYSTAYMKGDPMIHRYWAYLNLFCFSMLGLVLSDNLLLLYVFWELVGFSSYLLIGFWFTKDAAAQAAKKAFVMNRIGDVGFLCGLMIIYTQFGTFDLVSLFGDHGLVMSATISNGEWISGLSAIPELWLTIAGIAFFAGAAAKSAQFPLHTWLPDAMEGPTSVSSLIHAATMVAAGVFMVARIFPLFDAFVLDFISLTGTLTAFIAATIALTQNDIKRILAYSTISQLGFMMAALGSGAYSEGIFHLATHAFFKCLLFLAAGAVIHELHHFKEARELSFDHQDIREMRGLRRSMPVAFITMTVAAAALAGLPLTAGYLSKDALLIAIFQSGEGRTGLISAIPYILVLVSWLTTFYISRLIFKVFFGNVKFEGVHEAPKAMRRVMIVLAVCSSFVIFSLNPLSAGGVWLMQGLAAGAAGGGSYHLTVPVIVNLGSILLVTGSWLIYARESVVNPFPQQGLLYRLSNRGWYFDDIYKHAFSRPVEHISAIAKGFDGLVVDGIVNMAGRVTTGISTVSAWFDRNIVDGVINAIAGMAQNLGNMARRFQTGRLQHYLITMLSIMIAFFILTYLL